MNKNFIVLDKATNSARESRFIVKLIHQNQEYVVYSLKDSEENDQIYVSKLVLNTEGRHFINNITKDEKDRLNNIIYNVVMLLPTKDDVKKEMQEFSLKNNVIFSNEIPNIGDQEYFKDCLIAITKKEVVDKAINTYAKVLNEDIQNTQEKMESAPTWTIPSPAVDIPTPVSESVDVTNQNIIDMNDANTLGNSPIGNFETSFPNNSEVNNINVENNSPIPNNEDISQGISNPAALKVNTDIPSVSIPNVPTDNNLPLSSSENAPVDNPFTSQQYFNPFNNTSGIENKDNFFATNQDISLVKPEKIYSESTIQKEQLPTDNSSNINTPNIDNINNTGFVRNKYIIIGTVCLVLAILVVVGAYFAIRYLK